MNKVKVVLQNCYGIKKLEHEFDFSTSKTFAIYAPNGVMKTSFAKTFKDFIKGIDSSDLIFPKRKTLREIKRPDGSDLTKEEIFVIEPYDQNFNSEKMSTLLVNKILKDRYDQIHLKIDEEKDRLMKELKILSGLRDDIEREISRTFTSEDDKLFASFDRLEREITTGKETEFSDILYKEIFNEKVLKFLETKDSKSKISDYINKYDELIEKSKFFKKGVFNHNNATTIAKNLMDNGFFQANHSVYLNNPDAKSEIHTKEELEKVIDEEKNTILNDPELAKAFEEIDKILKANQELRNFRDYLMRNPKILNELKNVESFRQKIWISYLKSNKELYINVLNEYRLGEEELNKIVEEASKEKTHWESVIDIFNKRFSVPFKLKIKNQDDVILKKDVPSIAFVFKEYIDETPVEKNDLIQALSTGEKKALYILNIIFEVEARRSEHQETLFIVDDLADSFDYKNKYAIIQYLKDIAEDPLFYQIILTHNFDFFRTIECRNVVNYANCLFSYKSNSEVKLEKATGIKNPFIKDWKDHLNEPKKIIASIPFVRNIIEYTKGENDSEYKELTSLLHWKFDSDTLLMSNVKSIFENTISGINFPSTDILNKVVDKIFQEAETCLTATEGINFENKIVLSIAIRLKSERFMTNKINDAVFISSINNNQTSALYKRYKDDFPLETKNLELLDEVNLMTPENIHLNSFMYEPILDMSDQHLRNLYTKVKGLV